jgi:hypothetical protein
LPGAIVVREVCDFLATLAAAYPGFPVDWWMPPNIMAPLCPISWPLFVGRKCFECSFMSSCGPLCWLEWLWPWCFCRLSYCGMLLGLIMGVWMCCLCGFGPFAVDFHPVFS